MDKTHYKRYTDFCVDLYSTGEEPENRLLRGRALVNPKKGELSFVENAPRRNRSVEISRSIDGILRRRADGSYLITFRFEATGKLAQEQLLSDVRSFFAKAQDDLKKQKAKEKKEAKEKGGKENE